MISRFPSREQRQACWTARDAYWDCLDKHGLWLHGLRPREKPKEGGVPIENPELQVRLAAAIRKVPLIRSCLWRCI